MMPELVMITPELMVKVTPELTVHVSPEAMVASDVIVVSVVNVIDAASASWVNPNAPRIKILTMTDTTQMPFNAHSITV